MSTDTSTTIVPLLDHHGHGVTSADLDQVAFEALITESDWAAPESTTHFDSQLGFAIRRHCAPLLDLEPFASAEMYMQRRRDIGGPEVTRRFMQASGISDYFVETGHRADELLNPTEMADAGKARTFEIVRLERVAEDLIAAGCAAKDFRAQYAHALTTRLQNAVGVKTIAAYRIGLDFTADRPGHDLVDIAVSQWIKRSANNDVRLDDPVIIRHLIWTAVDRQCAIQFHIGYGDADVNLNQCSPLLLTDFLRITRDSGARILLLHCYPYHREAGYLAHVFPHVYFDVGLAINYTGSRSAAIIAESLEVAPFHKVLFSSDAFGVAELYYLGALLFRRGLAAALKSFAAYDGWPASERARVTELVAWRNARRAYRLDDAVFSSGSKLTSAVQILTALP